MNRNIIFAVYKGAVKDSFFKENDIKLSIIIIPS